MASTRPNRVSVLIEKPNIGNSMKVPTSETGTASSGMSVARQPCRKTKTTIITSAETIMNGKVKVDVPTWQPHQYRRTEPVAIAAAGFLYLMLLAHDTALIADTRQQGLYHLRPYAVLPLFGAIGWLLARTALHPIDRLAATAELGHCARANPQAQLLASQPQALVSFMGPQAYMSPKVYPDLVRVPTWSYVAVHTRVEATLIDEPHAKDRLLKQLIGDHEPPYVAQWRGLDIDYQQKMLSGIVAFELRITDVQCKLKLNQHRPESHAAMHAAYTQGTPDEQALAEWMVTLGMVPAQAGHAERS